MRCRKAFRKARYTRTHPVPSKNADETPTIRTVQLLTVLSDVLTHGRTIVLNVLLLAITLAIGAMAYRETRSAIVMINPVQAPEAIAKRGYSSEVIGNRIAYKMRNIDTTAKTIRPRRKLETPGGQVDIQIPGAGFGYRSIVRFAKEMFGFTDYKVYGDLIDEGEERLSLHVTVSMAAGKEQQLRIDGHSKDIEALLQNTAEAVMRVMNPYLLADYIFEIETNRCAKHPPCDYSTYITLLQEIIRGESTEDQKWALLGLAAAFNNLKQYERAIEKLRHVTELDPSFVAAYYNWGVSLYELGRLDEAIEMYSRANSIDPTDAGVLSNWAYVLNKLGRFDEAFEKYRQANRRDPNDAGILMSWGIDLQGRGRSYEAIQKYRAANKIDPRNTKVLNAWGISLYAIQDFEGAIEKWRHANAMDPENASIIYNWGLALMALGRKTEAIEKFNAALVDVRDVDLRENTCARLRDLGETPTKHCK